MDNSVEVYKSTKKVLKNIKAYIQFDFRECHFIDGKSEEGFLA